jgi:multiple antibiotic resistance protein
MTVSAFLLAFPALFSIVNPLGNAFIIEPLIGDLGRAERSRLVLRVALYSAAVMLAALWAGAAILNFFGVSLSALRLGGGLVILLSSLELLLHAENRDQRKQDQAVTSRAAADRAFFPITMPLTTGPGTISVAVAIGSERPEAWGHRLAFFAGVSAAAAALAGIIWLIYWSADRLAALLSPTTQRIISRLAAFLLLCIGVQIMITGAEGVVAGMQGHGHPPA